MFKKKKNDENQPAPEKAAPKAKAKKSKGSGGGGGGLKAFFLHHVEKIVLCGIAGVAGFLVYNGTTVKTLPTDKTPQQLTQISTTAESAIRQDHWSAIEADRKFDSNFSSVVERSSRPNDVSPYPAVVWDPKPDRGGQKRQDPKLLPPIDLEVHTVVASLASSTSNKRWVDPLKEYKNAPSYMKKGASLGGSGSGALGEEGSGSGFGTEGGSGKGMGGMGSGGQGGNDVVRNLTGKYDRGFGGASRSAGGSMGSEGGSLGDYGDAGMGSGSGSGMGMGMGSGGMGMKGSGGGSGTNPSAEVIPMPSAVMFNAITGLVPYEDQIKEYDLALANSANHDPRRDAPNYKGFTVQRVAITNGDPNREIKDDEWETLDEKKLRITPTQRDRWWQGVCPEIVHSYYTHPMLTMSIPPVLIHDYRGFAKHSKAPSIYDQVLLPGQKRVVDTEDGDFIKTGEGAGGAGKGMGMGMGAEGSGMGFGSEAGGMGLGMEGYGSMGSGGSELGGGYGSEDGGSGMGGMGSGMGGMGMGMGIGMPTIKSKYKVIRFYDFDVKPGVVYRYRVSVHVDDPNYSAYPNSPAMPTLEQEALKRVQVLEAADKKANEKILAEDYESNGRPKNMIDPRTGKKKLARKLTKTSERKSDWSVASRAVRAPVPGSIAVGKLASESRPYMQVATAEWKVIDGVGVDLFRLDLVTAGFVVAGKFSQSIGGTKAGPTLIHPLSRKVVLAPNELNEFRPRMALEVRMPEKLSLSSTKDPMETSAELVMVDMESGDVKISNEFADFDNFRMYSFADEQEAATKANRNAPPGGSGSGSGGGKGGGKNMGSGSSMSG